MNNSVENTSADAPSASTVVAPVSQSERIILLDSLRGIAVLGILIMNIPGFSMPYIQIFNPAVTNELSGPNFYAYYLVELILEGSQRAIFSMLFGASMLLFIQRLEKKIDGIMVAEYYFRRQIWLLVFGLFNAYILLWYWDILYHYAILGVVLFVFRRMIPKKLLIAAAVCLAIMTIRENVDFYRDKRTIAKGEAVAAIDTVKTKLSVQQTEDLQSFQGIQERVKKENKLKAMEKNVRKVRGTYADLYAVHSEHSFEGETAALFYFLIWDGLVFMFIGMAFYKTGILTGGGSVKLYAIMTLLGLGIGVPLSYLRIQPLIDAQFNYITFAKQSSFLFYEISRVIRSLGIFGLIMLCYKSGAFKFIFALLRPVGQMAFTNYLGQSFICGLIFYGVGFGYFAKLERYETFYVVGAVWVVEIIWSHLWLRYFRFGPMEWAWRSLTYWKVQPIRN